MRHSLGSPQPPRDVTGKGSLRLSPSLQPQSREKCPGGPVDSTPCPAEGRPCDMEALQNCRSRKERGPPCKMTESVQALAPKRSSLVMSRPPLKQFQNAGERAVFGNLECGKNSPRESNSPAAGSGFLATGKVNGWFSCSATSRGM